MLLLFMNRIDREKRVVAIMIDFYCKRSHHGSTLCNDCKYLRNYALFRLEKCVFENEKPACSVCKVHCYRTEMRENIRKVMRYSGPRILYAFPIHYIKHYLQMLFT